MGSRHADSNRTDRATRTSSTRGPGQGRPRRRTDRVEVEIRGKRLSVRTDHDPQRVHEMADYLDEKVRQLQAMAPSAPFDKLLMLASLTVVEELFEASEELSALREAIASRTESMIAMIDEEAARVGE